MLIGISGLQGSGKDTVANILKNKYGFYKYNLADPLYKIVYTLYPKSCLKSYFDNLGIWDSDKLENQKRIFKETELSDNYYGRNLLQDIGDVARKSDNYIFCKLAEEATFFYDKVVIPDIRTKYELSWLSSKATDSVLIYIERDGVINTDNHETESYQKQLYEAADIYLDNSKDIKYLEGQLSYYLGVYYEN